jgi:hypothetical protein
MAGKSLLVGALVALAATGCHKTLTGHVEQPNPLRDPGETLRQSEPIVIQTGDVDLRVPEIGAAYGALNGYRRYPLRDIARFHVVSRDRVRFHVQIEHKWREWTDLRTWKVELIDGEGTVHAPEAVTLRSQDHVVSSWDIDRRPATRDRYGEVVDVNPAAAARRSPLGSITVYRGRGDAAFFARDLFTSDTQTLTLRMHRDQATLEFTWHFVDGEVDDTSVSFVDGDHTRLSRVITPR